MDGYVLGGGMGLAQAASLRVITERTRMGMPEVGIGFFPDVGGSYFLPRLPGELGLYLGVTGVQVRAADALRRPGRLLPGQRTARRAGRPSRPAAVGDSPHEDLRALLTELATVRIPGSELKALRPAIDQHFALPTCWRFATRCAARAARLRDWAEETLRVLDSRSPLAMAVTLELLRRGRYLSLADCFALELHLDYQWFAKGDLMEGVRALIIDKDKQPRWNPPTLDELAPARVQALQRLPPGLRQALRTA